FPEFAHAAPVYETVEELRDRLAVPVPNEHTDRYHAKVRAPGVFLQTGTFLGVDPRYPGCVFNTTCLIGPDGLLSKYRKVHPWRPLENTAFGVTATRGAGAAHYPRFSWPGGSMVVDYDGRVLAQADPGPGEKIAIGPVDVAALRAERGRRVGHSLLAHRRTEAYRLAARPGYPAGAAAEGPITVAGNERRTRAAR